MTTLALPKPGFGRIAEVPALLGRWWPGWALTGALVLLVLYPLGMLFYASIRTGEINDASGDLTFANYARVFSRPETFQLVWTTVWLAGVRVFLGAVLGIFLAWAITRTDTPGRRWFELLVWVQFFAPPLPILVAWTLLGAKTGVMNTWLQNLPFIQGPLFNIYSYGGIIWVSTLTIAAFIFVVTVPAFRAMDAALEESARVSGAGTLRVLRTITVPVVLPSVLGAVFLAFIFALESFEPEVLLGLPANIYVLSTQIFVSSQQYPTDLPGATALSSVFLLAVMALIAVQARLLAGRSFTTVTGRGFSTQPTRLGRWRFLTLGLLVGYFLIAMALPLGTLVIGSFMKAWGVWDSGATLNNWTNSLADPRLVGAILNTIVLGVLVGLGGTLVCALVGYLLVRTKFTGKPLLEFITWAPRTAPGIVLAIAFFWAYAGGVPFFKPLLGTLWILVIVLSVNAIPLSSRVLNAGMHQVSHELEEAGWISGAGWFNAFRKILLPLLAPALMTSFVLLFLSAIRNLVLVVFFYRPQTRVLSAIFWESWTGNFPERALVAGLLMMAISLLALGLALLVGRRLGSPVLFSR